ncbi:hypothetical protein APR04_000850 [Promicromonospora umidemergens]|uniref:Uncharacterized protein n=1 Tax=Promicromonospora umidemergens TaxID=629679 RepID=A0ABP8XM76_9MICO|nr:hypothetical protein [Promicromonospora umidemergens]MCP2281955.1 hypothetical protein [Promicromonospora umidemergens]
MADGTESQVSDGSSADSPQGTHTHHPNVDPGRVARIVAALRTAHAEQAASATAAAAPAVPPTVSTAGTGDTADTAEILDPPAPRRETSGVRPAKPPVPTLRWNPGSRYRASRLANRAALQAPPAPSAGPGPVHAPVPPAPPAPPTAHGAVVGGAVPGPVPAPPALAGRLYRGPARRTGVFEREIWYPVAQSSRVPREVGEALVAAVERYRKGSISTSGLVRAIGKAHAA